MNCIWGLKRAKGRGFGKMLVEDMVQSEGNAAGFATIALENHWSPWFKKGQMEKRLQTLRQNKREAQN
jgi:hypothetical protein